jgi:hypothetical protein
MWLMNLRTLPWIRPPDSTAAMAAELSSVSIVVATSRATPVPRASHRAGNATCIVVQRSRSPLWSVWLALLCRVAQAAGQLEDAVRERALRRGQGCEVPAEPRVQEDIEFVLLKGGTQCVA